MKTFQDFITEARKKVKIEVNPQKPIEYKIADIGPEKKEYNVKTSKGWTNEAYDADVMSSSQVRRTGEGGRIGAKRKKTTPERRRVRAVGGGKTEPVSYRPRADIGKQRARSEREQAPQQERGAADVKARAAAAAKEERKKAAQARIAARKAGQAAPAAKPKAKEVEKQASKLLSTKKPQPQAAPGYKPRKASGYSHQERQKVTRAGERELRNIMKQQEIEKYKKATGEAPKGKSKTKVLAHVEKRMAS